jgi:S-adenosylmethionine-dependent methyltransferase
MITRSDDERFQNGGPDYAAYLEMPEGRLRADLAIANLGDFLSPPQAKKTQHALDVGCGTGAAAVRLARLGFHITQLDSSQAMLDIARRTAEEAGVTNRVTLRHGDAARLTDLFRAASFDVVLCHHILEYVDDPATVLRGAAPVLRDTRSVNLGTGENGMHPDFRAILAYLSTQPVKLTITSNGQASPF